MKRMQMRLAVVAGVVVWGLGLGVAWGQTTEGNVTWSGGGTPPAQWSDPANWAGGEAPANPTPGEITFGAAGQAVTSIVEVDRQVARLQNAAGTTHTINLGGNTLTITNRLATFSGWGINPSSLLFTNGTVRLGAAGSPVTLNVRPHLSFNHASTMVDAFNVDTIHLEYQAQATRLDFRNAQFTGNQLKAQHVMFNTSGAIELNAVNAPLTLAVPGDTRIIQADGSGNLYIGDPGNLFAMGGSSLGRLPAGISLAFGTDAATRGNLLIGRATPDGTSRAAIAAASGGAGTFTAYLNNLRIGYSEVNASAIYGMLDVAAMSNCTLDALTLHVGTDRPSSSSSDNMNGTLRLGPGTATVANAVIGGNTLGFGTLSISNTLFAVTNSLTLHPSARLQIATGADSKGLDVSGTFALAGSGVEVDVLFMEPTQADTTNWAIRVKGNHATALNSMIGTGRLTWSLDAGITDRKAGVVSDNTYTYFALVDESTVFDPVAIAQDVTFERVSGTVWVHVSEVDNGSFDPEGRTVQLRLIYNGGSPSESLSFTSDGSYPVTLQVDVMDGATVVATATDSATIHVVAPPAGTQANVEWNGEADTVLNTDRREWFWSDNWSGSEPPANPFNGTVFLRTFGQSFRGRLGADRQVYRLNAPSGGTTHTVDLGGNRLTVTDLLSAGSSQSSRSYLYFTNGVVQVGTDTAAASINAVMSDLSLNRDGVSLETRNISSITMANAPWGGGNIDLRGVQFMNNELRAGNIYVQGRGEHGIRLDGSAAGMTIRVPGHLRMWMTEGSGSSCMGNPQDLYTIGGGNLWRLPAGVSLYLGTDAKTRGTLEMARATPHGALRGGIVVASGGGGTFTGYLSHAKIGYSAGGSTAAHGILDLMAMDTCMLDVLSLEIGTDRPSPNAADNFNGTLRLGPGTAVIGNAVVGGIGAGVALWEMSNTVSSVTNSLVLNKTAQLVIHVGAGQPSGIHLTREDPGSLSINPAATITVRFLEKPTQGGLHYGLRLAGDWVSELTDMGGNLVIDSSGLPEPAEIMLHQGDTYVGWMPPPAGTVIMIR